MTRNQPQTNRSVTRTSGAHITRIFSTIVKVTSRDSPDNDDVGFEVFVALTSTGGWHIFECKESFGSQRRCWVLSLSWDKFLTPEDFPKVISTPKSASDGCKSVLDSLHTVCTKDMIPIDSRHGNILFYMLNGLGKVQARVINFYSQDLSKSSKFVDLPCKPGTTAIVLCYLQNINSLAYGCENGNVSLLYNITPSQIGTDDLEITYTSHITIWKYDDVCVDSIKCFNTPFDSTLMVTKGAFLSCWGLKENKSKNGISTSQGHCTKQLDQYPIIAMNKTKEQNIFQVCTHRAVFSVEITSTDNDVDCATVVMKAKKVLDVHQISPTTVSLVGNENVPSGLNSNANITTSLDSYRKQHAASKQWAFFAMGHSAGNAFAISTTSIFSPCKASLLLAPPLSIKLYSLKSKSQMEESHLWDFPFVHLFYSISDEEDVLKIAKKFSAINNRTPKVDLQQRYLLIHKISEAYTNGCALASIPEQVVKATEVIRNAIWKQYLAELTNKINSQIDSVDSLPDLKSFFAHCKVELPQLIKAKMANTFHCPICRNKFDGKNEGKMIHFTF